MPRYHHRRRSRHRPRARAAGLFVLLLGAVTTSCLGRRGPADDLSRAITVSVENHNWQDVTVFVLRPGQRIRLGTVRSMADRRFDLPPSFRSAEVISLVAEVIGSSERRGTGRIMVRDHSEVLWTLENRLALSSYVVR